MKIVVVLHLFYHDLWAYFEQKLSNLDTDFDLIITMDIDNKNKNKISEQIKKTYPNAIIMPFKNKGLDVGPFLMVMKYMKENNMQYDYLIKLHTKKSTYNLKLGSSWRSELVDSIIGNKNVLHSCIETIKTTENKMCGCRKWVKRGFLSKYKNILSLDSIKDEKPYFIGGTMFISDFNILLDGFTEEQLLELYEKMLPGYRKDGTTAHDVERLLGFVIQNKGYKIKGV